MGLLDNLLVGHSASFGGEPGGILDFIRRTQMQNQQYQPSSGFEQPNAIDTANWPVGPVGAPTGEAPPIAVGNNYQMPRIGGMAQFTPAPSDPAALPANAQPTQGQLPAAQPSIGGNVLTGLQSFLNGGGLISSIRGAAEGRRVDPRGMAQEQENQTAQFLVSKGMDPAMAKTVVSDPGLMRVVVPQIMGIGGSTDDIKEYQFAKKEDPSLTFEKFMARKKAVSGEYGLNYVYGTDKDGKTVAFAPGKSGEPKQIQFPEGINIARGIEKIDTGTQVVIRDKQTGTVLGVEKKDVAGKEAAEKVGQAKGAAQAALANGADIDAEQTKKKIDELIAHKGFNEIFGQLDQYRPSWTHSNEGTDALARYKQLKGTAFLSAYTMLKGGGAITDIEGQKAGDAMARLDRAQSEDEAKAALRDFREAVDIGLQKLKRAAGGEAVNSQPTAMPNAAPKRIRLNADGTIAQ